MYGLDIVPVGIQHECCVVARVVTALAGAPVVASARSQGHRMKLVDRSAIRRLKRKVNLRHGFTRFINKQFIRIK